MKRVSSIPKSHSRNSLSTKKSMNPRNKDPDDRLITIENLITLKGSISTKSITSIGETSLSKPQFPMLPKNHFPNLTRKYSELT